MINNPWKTDNWFVSPWNYAKEVRNCLNFPPKIKVHDITLRDGEQQAGIEFTLEDKIRIAEGLAEVGVHRIEAGLPAVSSSDEAAIKEIVKRNLGPDIFAFSRCMIEDVKRAIDCGVSGVVMEIPSSEHIIEKAYQWRLERAIELSIESTNYAHQHGIYVVFFPIDSTRAELDWYLDLIHKVSVEGHMDALGLVDTFGVCSPPAATLMTQRAKTRLNKPLETHFHNDFGLAVANTLASLAAGAEVMHTTVLGIGERAGNTSFEETAMALRLLYGIDLGLNYENLSSLSKLVEKLSGQAVPSNKPIVGDLLFHIESGIIASWYKNCGQKEALELFPFSWSMVGQSPPEIVIGKGSGIDSIEKWLDELGFETNPEKSKEILTEVKLASMQKKGLLNRDEFTEIATRFLGKI
jgi:isopropylmalate/homocitrate/citramalate synthase